jgi:methylated-DNA-protein-cysteine methyltransferase-like protein
MAKTTRSHTYRRIWRTVRRIPPGRVATYGQIALIAGFPRQARLVGYALHHTPDRLDIPWHRVINARGEISFPKGSSHYEMQLNRLLEEGVVFVGGRVDLDRYRWRSSTRSRIRKI